MSDRESYEQSRQNEAAGPQYAQAPIPPYAQPSAQPPVYPNYPDPHADKPKGSVSIAVLAWSVVLSIVLTACFTLGLVFALNFAKFAGGFVTTTPKTTTEATTEAGTGATVLTPGGLANDTAATEISVDGISIRVAENADEETKAKAQKLAQAIDAFQRNFYRELSSAELLEAMTAGLPSNLGSPYSYYMTAEEFASMQDSNAGHYSGIGAKIMQNLQGAFEFIDITPSSPAEAGGLKSGDIITSVDGTNAGDFPNTTALANQVKGPEGTMVVLEIYRPSEGRSFKVELTRRTIAAVYVSHKMLEDEIGYLNISEFSSNMPDQFESSLRDLVKNGAKNIVFDLRNNPGGDAMAVQQVLDMLLPEGIVATVKGRENGQFFEENWTSTDGQLVPEDMKFVALLNKNSASASELFAGALRDRAAATIIGEQSFGKGSGTRFYTLEDGSAVNVTIFLYYFPGGDTPEGEGITPNIEVKLPDEVAGKAISQLTLQEDTQLAEAIKVLK